MACDEYEKKYHKIPKYKKTVRIVYSGSGSKLPETKEGLAKLLKDMKNCAEFIGEKIGDEYAITDTDFQTIEDPLRSQKISDRLRKIVKEKDF